ncbi:transcriptional regulator GcvA [Magnetospira sp. QH-2]|uniref:transcriptional regulator GcvA n=1 Tax=Magnetospira sp. (strain QH-2) TaxID=1288970 RepID=UPI0003E80F7C|nr:transcriptional regulator GcvA [Magnetospira sp. QH-2]CCQ73594.1 Glycine cleavage system transcriptional activator. DNA-binding transcriptional dual regulator [Magnetospira sp. QH-2]
MEIDVADDQLPPLNSLRAFEAAARHLSFKNAAEELHVTPAAISQQIKNLELLVGAPLFRRQPRGLLLTDEAQQALPLIRYGFQSLAAGFGKMSRRTAEGRLTIAVPSGFGARWLVPRLAEFQQRNPKITVHLDASDRLVDFARDHIHMAIRYGQGDYAGLHEELVLAETAYPVCSPALLRGERPLDEPGDLVHHTLLHHGRETGLERRPWWSKWMKAAGVAPTNTEEGMTFNLISLVIAAAVAGQGIALISKVLVEEDLAAGRLVLPFGGYCPPDWRYGYYVLCRPDAVSDPKIELFKAWLHESAEAYRLGGSSSK